MHNNGGVATISIRTTTTTTTGSDSGSMINYMYFKTVPGILKIVEILFGIICIATASPVVYNFNGTYFFLFVCYATGIITLAWIFVIFFRIETKVNINPSWRVLEFVYTGIAFWLYSLATTVQFTIFSPYSFAGYNSKPRSVTAAVFGLFNSVAYGIGLVYTFRNWRSVTIVQRNGQYPVY